MVCIAVVNDAPYTLNVRPRPMRKRLLISYVAYCKPTDGFKSNSLPVRTTLNTRHNTVIVNKKTGVLKLIYMYVHVHIVDINVKKKPFYGTNHYHVHVVLYKFEISDNLNWQHMHTNKVI